MKHPNGALLTAEQHGQIRRHVLSLYADEEKAFYDHYWVCDACKPGRRDRCQVGAELGDSYSVACTAASIVSIRSRDGRVLALSSVPERHRDLVAGKVQELWPCRLPGGIEIGEK